MKKLLFFPVLILLSQLVTAQITSGTKFIGGSINSNGSTSEQNQNYTSSSKYWGVGIAPSFAYFIKDNFALGIQLGYGYSQEKNNQSFQQQPTADYKNKNNNFSFSPFIRNYKMFGEKFGVFLQSGLSIGFGKQKSENYLANQTTEQTSTSFGINTQPGVIYFLTPKWTIEASSGAIGFSANTYKYKTEGADNKSSNFNFGLNWNITTLNLGIRYYF